MIALLQTSQKAFVESACIETTFAVSSDSCNHICWNFWQLRFTRKFFLPDSTTCKCNWTTWKYRVVG